MGGMPLVEFTVVGPPVSHQSRNKVALGAWKARVRAAAAAAWAEAPLQGPLKCTIMNFHEGPDPVMDDDNMVKPVRDAMNGVIYVDDRQIRLSVNSQSGLRERYDASGASLVALTAFSAGVPFVYIRVEDGPIDIQLPR